MTEKGRTDVPNWVFTAGEKVQTAAKKIPLDWLINPFVGSNSPNYVQAEWHRADQVIDYADDEPTSLPIAYGNSNASPLTVISRLKKQAAVLGSPVDQLNRIVKEYDAEGTVAFTYRGQTRVGVLPRGILEFSVNADTFNYQAAMRMGRNEVGAAIGAWLPKEKVLIKPIGAIVAHQNMSLQDLTSRYPSTPLV